MFLMLNSTMNWIVRLDEAFDSEFDELPTEVQDEFLAQAHLLGELGPMLGRPWVDTLNGSHHANMKELRLNVAGGVWRVAFAFNPERRAVLLVAGNKSGISERRFYRRLLKKADERFDVLLERLKEARK